MDPKKRSDSETTLKADMATDRGYDNLALEDDHDHNDNRSGIDRQKCDRLGTCECGNCPGKMSFSCDKCGCKNNDTKPSYRKFFTFTMYLIY